MQQFHGRGSFSFPVILKTVAVGQFPYLFAEGRNTGQNQYSKIDCQEQKAKADTPKNIFQHLRPSSFVKTGNKETLWQAVRIGLQPLTE